MPIARKVSLSIAVVILGLVAAFALRQENLTKGVPWIPRCLLQKTTGLYCPSCGNTRATHALLNGDVLGAWRQNPAFLIALPFLLWGAYRVWMRWVFPEKLRPFPFRWRYGYSVALILLVVLFGVVRNLPWKPFSWLAPLPVTTTESAAP